MEEEGRIVGERDVTMEEDAGKVRNLRPTRCTIVAFEDGERGPQAKECGWLLEVGNSSALS